jgi:hypothetical protein
MKNVDPQGLPTANQMYVIPDAFRINQSNFHNRGLYSLWAHFVEFCLHNSVFYTKKLRDITSEPFFQLSAYRENPHIPGAKRLEVFIQLSLGKRIVKLSAGQVEREKRKQSVYNELEQKATTKATTLIFDDEDQEEIEKAKNKQSYPLFQMTSSVNPAKSTTAGLTIAPTISAMPIYPLLNSGSIIPILPGPSSSTIAQNNEEDLFRSSKALQSSVSAHGNLQRESDNGIVPSMTATKSKVDLTLSSITEDLYSHQALFTGSAEKDEGEWKKLENIDDLVGLKPSDSLASLSLADISDLTHQPTSQSGTDERDEKTPIWFTSVETQNPNENIWSHYSPSDQTIAQEGMRHNDLSSVTQKSLSPVPESFGSFFGCNHSTDRKSVG